MSNRDISYAKLLAEDNSFQLVRTNPKLTGNVKITINDAGGMWLESIKANPELSKDLYSKVTIDTNQSHAANIFRFFNSGSTPNEIIFDLSEKVDTTKTSKDFKDQYDFSHYFSGVKYLASKKYDERMSYFAPLYLKKDIPDYFIIFKIEDPANFPLDQIKQKYEAGESKTDYIIDLFSKASIIQTFDLRADTVPGKYLRDYINSPNFPISPLTVSYEENDFTTWNGILINEGTLGSRGELLNSLYTSSQPLKFFEENITNGFSRNGIIFPNIVNLEFIFNDTSSSKYDFNRYLGLYVNAIELSKLDIDLDRAYLSRGNWENTPHFRKKFLETDEVILNQTNSNGVIIPFKNSTINFSEFKDTFSDSSNMFINYISDKDSNLYMPNINQAFEIEYSPEESVSFSSSGYLVTATLASHGYSTDDLIVITSSDLDYSGEFLITKIDDNTYTYTVQSIPANPTAIGTSKKELNTGQFRFANKNIDLGLFFGQSRNIFLQDIGTATKTPGHSYGVIKIESELNNYDEIKLYHPHGTRIDSIGKYDLIISTQGYSLIPNPGEYYVYNDYDNIIGYDEFYLNGSGTSSQIAGALSNCINGIRNRAFTAYSYDDRVFIKLNPAGDFDLLHKISFTSPTSDYSVITVNDIYTGSDLISTQIDFKGGSKEIGNRLIIDSGHLEKINQNIDSILIKSSDSWSKIRKVSKYIDEINETNSSTQVLRTKTLNDYDNKIVIVLDENEIPTISNKEFLMKTKFRPSFGLLSFYLVKDLDFDFYSSSYSNFPNIDLYQHYFIPPNTLLLEPGIDYIVYNGTINVDDGTLAGINYPANSQFTVTNQTSYSVVSGSPFVTYDQATLNNTIAINDGDEELKNFPGFSILKDPSKVVAQDSSIEYSRKTKYLNGLTQTEYDYYKENESLDFALRSKIIPYITKWGIKNGKDSRDNPYRLNTELVFGRNNFSPDHEDSTQNPINFTHEWFYIESNFNYINDESLVSQNTNYFDTKFNETLLLSDPEYFINYFTYTPTTISGKEIADTQFRYSQLFKNSASQYEAFFKGFKLSFRDVTDSNTIGANGKPIAKDTSTRFDGYKFSCILRAIKEDINDQKKPPIRYRVIEHTDYKFIVVLIEIVLGSIDVIDQWWKDNSLSNNTLLDTTNFNDKSLFYPLPAPPYPVYPFETIDGDYRIEFDANNVSNLTHTLLYSLKNKKYNNITGAFANIKMASKLDIAGGVDPADQTIRRLQNQYTTLYPAILTDDLPKPKNSTIVFIKDSSTGFNLFLDKVASLSPTDPFENTIDYSLDQLVHYTSPLCLADQDAVLYGILPTSLTSLINEYYTFKVLTGGEKYYEKLFEKISFAKFKKYVNELNPFIEYESYSLDSNNVSIKSDQPNFYLEIPDISKVEKENQVITNYTKSVPIQFSGQNEIGTDYEVADLPVKYSLNRYTGDFEPVVRNYSIYQSNYEFKKNPINDLSLSNVKLNTDVTSILSIQNFNHIKVADSQILVLESDDSYLPVYPKISEVAIGQADYFLLRGNWDWGFHYKYSNKNTYTPVSGARRVEEDDSFLAKLITLPEYIELDNFKIQYISSDQEFNTVDISTIEIVAKETPLTVEGVINLNNVLTRYLIEDGIDAKFNEYLINSNEFIGNFNTISDADITVSSYVKEYIKLNILKLYDIDINEFYVKDNTSLISTNTQSNSNPNSIEFVFLNDKQRFTQGYNILKSLQINKKDKLILKFSFAKKQGSGLSISPKIKIKFI